MVLITNPKTQRWNSELSRTDALADTRVYKQVAMANTFNKTKSDLFVTAMEVYKRVKNDQDVVGSSHNLRARPY
jgi:hypothetical protein